MGPQMPFVVFTGSLPGCGERLAGATACPNRSTVIPSGIAERDTPQSSTGEEMALREFTDLIRLNLSNGSTINDAIRNHPVLHQAFEDVRRCRFDLVKIDGHQAPQ
jgi:hypothetical protein